MDKPQDYAIPVHRSILQRDLIAGLSKTGAVLLLAVTIFFVFGLSQWWFLIVSMILYMVLRSLTKKDEYMVDIILNQLMHPDELQP